VTAHVDIAGSGPDGAGKHIVTYNSASRLEMNMSLLIKPVPPAIAAISSMGCA
jgi:hypothetical protein